MRVDNLPSRQVLRLILLLPGLIISHSSYADMEREIQHLLHYVNTTNCLYERNGDMHNGPEAVVHIKKKYAYFEDDIETTEDFIKYSATKSLLSGSVYKIHCEHQAPVNSSAWLNAELQRFRQRSIPKPSL